MTTTEAIAYLENYQKWRSGDDERTMDEAGIKPRDLTKAMDVVLAFAKEQMKPASPKLSPGQTPNQP